MARRNIYTKLQLENLKGLDHLEGVYMDSIIILKSAVD
jgi:hypothetical protein